MKWKKGFKKKLSEWWNGEESPTVAQAMSYHGVKNATDLPPSCDKMKIPTRYVGGGVTLSTVGEEKEYERKHKYDCLMW